MKIARLCLVLIFLRNAAFCDELVDSAKAIEDWIISIRRELHQIPELEFDLPKTSKAIRNVLDQLDISYKYPVARSGIVAKIGSGTPVIGLRADMDALPIQEPPGLSFASKHEGKMHACGHDAHTSMLLGAARLIKEREGTFPGAVKLFFQPAEETFSGAKLMINEGHLDGVSMMFTVHVWSGLESGIVQTRSGVIMGGVNSFKVTVTGKGGHAADPELAIDPMIPVTKMILAYQTILSRTTSPLESHVISVTKINGGQAFNVIPDFVCFEGTMRSLERDGIERLTAKFIQLTEDIAGSFDCQAKVEIILSVDPLLNDDTATRFATKVAQKLFGKKNVGEGNQSTGGEDFAYFAQRVPASFIYLGIHNETAGSTGFAHSANYKVDEEVLHKGTALYAALALNYLNNNSRLLDQKAEL